MDKRSFKKQTLFVGLQSSFGVPSTTFTYLPAESFDLTAEAAAKVEIKEMKPSYSPTGMTNIGAKYTASSNTLLRPGGASGNNPLPLVADPLLQASGFNQSSGKVISVSTSATYTIGETVTDQYSSATATLYATTPGKLFIKDITGGSFSTSTTGIVGSTSNATSTASSVLASVVYTLHSSISSAKYATLKYNLDGVEYLAQDVQASPKFTLKDSDNVRLDFSNILGIYNDPTAVSLGSVDCTAKPPLISNPLVVIWGAYDPSAFVITSIDIDIANEVSEINDVQNSNSISGVIINGRAPKMNISMSAAQLSNFNPYTNARNNVKQLMGLGVNLNGAIGERIWLHCPAVQFEMPKTKDEKGLVSYDIAATLTGCNDDEFYVTVF